MSNVKSFPVQLTPIQEACQQIIEYNPKMLIAVMQDEEGNVSYILPPGELWTEVVGCLAVAQHSIMLDAAGIE